MSGKVASLNYPTTLLTDIAYTACVRQENGYCGIEWSQAATTTDSFQLNAGAATTLTVSTLSYL